MLVRTFTLTLISIVLAACSAVTTPPAETPTDTAAVAADGSQVRKSPNDTRNYRYLVLPNELRVLLVSDLATEKSAAALTVNRGSFHEPENRAGLAHFLEHMLFIQTETYPEVDAFQHHISANGGSSNAYTALDHTNYFFDIAPSAFPEALDRFAHFFIDPMLAPEYAEREKNAVNSEYQLQLKDDGWRGYMVGKQVLNPAHPGSKFTIGSLDTLAGDIHEDLVDFFETQYSADQMALVVISNASLDELEALVRPKFSTIDNKSIGPDFPDVPLYTDEQLPAIVEIQTQKDVNTVSYNFPLPSTQMHYRKKPEQYFSNLLGHEGPGSLYQLLNKRGWAESLGAGVEEFDENNSVASISIQLTPTGQAHIPEITDALFQYIALLQSTPAEEWLYNEQSQVAALNFRFQEKSSPMSVVYRMAPTLHKFPPEDLLVAPYLMEGFDAGLIKQYLSYLTPENLLMQISGPDIKGESVEPWFEVPYTLRREPAPRTSIEAALALPKPNPYLPERLGLLGQSGTIDKTVDVEGIELWRHTDTQFGSPRANLRMELATPGGFVTAQERAWAQLYRTLVEDSLSADVYPAYLAGLGYSLGVGDAGFEIGVSGYADKQLTLLQDVVAQMLTLDIDADKFAQFKASLVRSWRNEKKERPFNQAMSAMADTLQDNRWPRDMLVTAIEQATPAKLAAWRDAVFSQTRVRGLWHGNISPADEQALVTYLQSRFNVSNMELVEAQVRDVDQSVNVDLKVDHNDAAIVLHIQDADSSLESQAMSALVAQMLHNPYFSQLRTEQQLGYVVGVSNRAVANRAGISFIVQSPVQGAAYLEQATRTFLDGYLDAWPELGDDEIKRQKLGLINNLLEKPKNLGELSGRYVSDLRRGFYSFDRRTQMAELVENFTRAQILEFIQGLSKDLDARRLAIYSTGQFEDSVPEKGVLLEDPTADWS